MRILLVSFVGLLGISVLSEPVWAVDSVTDSLSVVGDIEVAIEGVRVKDEGVLVVTVFRGEDGWLEREAAVADTAVPVTNDTSLVTFEQMPYDSSYAIQVIHDKNRNGKFDMRWFPFPKPKEGAGVSNNNLRRGPPDYEKARFVLAEPTKTLRIQLQY